MEEMDEELALRWQSCFQRLLYVPAAKTSPAYLFKERGQEDVQSSGSGGGGKHWGAWGSNSTIESHDESLEVTKDLQKNCSGVIVTLNQGNADYTVMLNRESKRTGVCYARTARCKLRIRWAMCSARTLRIPLGERSEDACAMVVADWQAHGRLNAPSSAAAPAAQGAEADQQPPAEAPAGAQVTPVAYQPQAATAPPSQSTTPASDSGVSSPNASLGDAARNAKQHQACLQLAKDNPSIVCK